MGERARRIVDRAGRGLVVAAIAVALTVGVCAFLDGSELHFSDEVRRYDAGGFWVLLVVVPLVAGGALVWRWPRPRLVWLWAAIGWLAGPAYPVFLAGKHHAPEQIFWPLRVVEVGWLIAAGMVMYGAPLLGFAMTTASATYDGSDPVLARRARRFTTVVLVFGALLCAVGFLPGTRVYDDSRNCFSNALGAAFAGVHTGGCTPSFDELSATRLAGGLPLVLYLLLVLAPAVLVLRDPRRSRLWLFAAWGLAAALPAGVVYFTFEFHLDLFSHVETLWPARAVEAGMALLHLLVVFGPPILALTTREPKAGALSGTG